MRFSYNKLWKLLIDRGIKKKELAEKAGISATSIAKLGKGGNVNTKVLLSICTALECNIEDIMELVPGDDKESKTIDDK
jgi:DNA-binding Xre family transcriptional regulator